MKTCSKCKKEKPLSAFYKCSSTLDGHSYICKDCEAQRSKLRWAERRRILKNKKQKEAIDKVKKRKKDFTLTDLQKGYIAGFIDSDGSISITQRNKGTRLTTKVTFGNTNKECLEKIKTWLKLGNIYTVNKKPKHKNLHQLTITKRSDLILLLEEISPYLLIKKRQAELMLEFCYLRIGYSGYYQTKCFEIFNELRGLNTSRRKGNFARTLKSHKKNEYHKKYEDTIS